MWLQAATDPGNQGSDQTQIILGILGLLGLLGVAIVGGWFNLAITRQNRTTPAPPSPVPSANESEVMGKVRERLAVLERRADDSDDRDEVQDRRLDQVEDRLDLDNPRWGPDGR